MMNKENKELTVEEVQFTAYGCGDTRYACMNDCVFGGCTITCAE